MQASEMRKHGACKFGSLHRSHRALHQNLKEAKKKYVLALGPAGEPHTAHRKACICIIRMCSYNRIHTILCPLALSRYDL
jgi:hypothetical protein